MLSKFRKKSRTNQAENRQKIKNSPPQLKNLLFLKNKSVFDLFTFEKFRKLFTSKYTHKQPQERFTKDLV